MLRRVEPGKVLMAARRPVDHQTLTEAATIVEEVRRGGEKALRNQSERLGDLLPDEAFELGPDQMEQAYRSLSQAEQGLLTRTADRIRRFAEAQLAALGSVTVEVPGGRAGHHWIPIASVGTYAPGGRHPLPSSVLMTVVPATVAGVGDITLATPRPTAVTLAAAHVAGADRLLAVGGAQAIAALAFGIGCPAADLIAGPGNRWVTAAKKHLFGEIGIDGLAGPSEIVVVADHTADAALVAADLMAQAEHDSDAVVALVTTSPELAAEVDRQLQKQLETLPTAPTAVQALDRGLCVVVDTIEEAVRLTDIQAPEHLALHIEDAGTWTSRFSSYGSMFIGRLSSEALADYGIGPNHVLPTGRTARFQSGLSVMTYLRSPTWLEVHDASPICADVTGLAREEGLEAHARAAQMRITVPNPS